MIPSINGISPELQVLIWVLGITACLGMTIVGFWLMRYINSTDRRLEIIFDKLGEMEVMLTKAIAHNDSQEKMLDMLLKKMGRA